MGCRLWWGKPGTLQDRDLGVWNGHWLGGVNGPRPGRFELAFEGWCQENGHTCLRTVNLFWAFQYHRNGFPSHSHVAPIRKNWCDERKQRREAPRKIQQGRVLNFGLRKSNREEMRLHSKEIKSYIDRFYPDPGPWDQYYADKRGYFAEELARYRGVLAFWRLSAKLRKIFLQCANYSNRRPESHPDYLLLFQNRNQMECAFIEVKSPKESLRPSQKKFFPELVKKATQRVLVVRLTEDGKNARFFEFNKHGDLLPCAPPGSITNTVLE
jgi:hypothetical protein